MADKSKPWFVIVALSGGLSLIGVLVYFYDMQQQPRSPAIPFVFVTTVLLIIVVIVSTIMLGRNIK